ncbi:MAG: hypothetical protein LUG13_00595 [Oscillospiraceae bacterium]|nr:hypothetical protein [Oscillospiraceae bacterium]
MLGTCILVLALSVFGTWGVMFSVIYAATAVKKVLGAVLFCGVIGWLLFSLLSGDFSAVFPLEAAETLYEVPALIYVQTIPDPNSPDESAQPDDTAAPQQPFCA